MQVPQWVKPGVWGVVIGTIGIMIVGFSWLGWTLGSTAETLAQDRVNAALIAAFTPICVERLHEATRCHRQTCGVSKNQLVAATGIRGKGWVGHAAGQ